MAVAAAVTAKEVKAGGNGANGVTSVLGAGASSAAVANGDKKGPVKVDKEKLRAMEAALTQIEKQFGKGTIMRLGEFSASNVSEDAIPTGSLSLDIALGVWGVPRGRVVEVFGPESSGKTTLALHILAEAQKLAGVCAFVDAEHALDPEYARNIGVDTQNLLVSQPDHGEQALEIVDMLVRSGSVDLIVVDSVAALVPKAEIEGEMGDSHVGLQARLMSQALRKLTANVSRTKCVVVFINQLRDKIGGMSFAGAPETTSGGRALKYYATLRLDVRRIETLKSADGPVGNRVRVKVVKNKVAPPFRLGEFDILFGKGISRTGEILDCAAEQGVVKKSGAFYMYEDTRIGQGRDNARAFLEQNTDMLDKIETLVKDKVKAKQAEAAANRNGNGNAAQEVE